MATERKWIQAATIAVDTETGALLVTGMEGGGSASVALTMAAPIVYQTAGVSAAQVTSTSIPCRYVRVSAGVDLTTGVPLNTVPVGVGISGTGNQKVPVMPNNFEGVILPLDNVNKLYVISPGGSGQTVVVVPYVVAS